MSLHKETVGLAGEYAVASELCKRGMYTQLTLGNKKRTDLLVEVGDNFIKVEVKSKQEGTWPAVKGISRENYLLVFVDFQDKKPEERPDFYILSVADWKKLVIIKSKKDPTMVIDKDSVPTWPGISWKGIGVKPENISKFKEKWDKFSF